jgi:hypothetical protein
MVGVEEDITLKYLPFLFLFSSPHIYFIFLFFYFLFLIFNEGIKLRCVSHYSLNFKLIFFDFELERYIPSSVSPFHPSPSPSFIYLQENEMSEVVFYLFYYYL